MFEVLSWFTRKTGHSTKQSSSSSSTSPTLSTPTPTPSNPPPTQSPATGCCKSLICSEQTTMNEDSNSCYGDDNRIARDATTTVEENEEDFTSSSALLKPGLGIVPSQPHPPLPKTSHPPTQTSQPPSQNSHPSQTASPLQNSHPPPQTGQPPQTSNPPSQTYHPPQPGHPPLTGHPPPKTASLLQNSHPPQTSHPIPQSVSHPPAPQSVSHPPAPQSVSHPPVPQSVSHPPAPQSVSHPPVPQSVSHPPAPQSVSHPPAPQSVSHPPAPPASMYQYLQRSLFDRTISSSSEELSLGDSFNSITSPGMESVPPPPCDSVDGVANDSPVKKARVQHQHMSIHSNGDNNAFIKPTTDEIKDLPIIRFHPASTGLRMLTSLSDTESVCSTPSPDTPAAGGGGGGGSLPGGFYDFTNSSVRTKRAKMNRYSVEEVLDNLAVRIPRLFERNDYKHEFLADLQFVKRRTSWSPDETFRLKIADKLIELNIVDLFIRIWNSIHDDDEENREIHESPVGLKNIVQIVIILWNTSDISRQLCRQITDKGCLQLGLMDLKSAEFALQKLGNDNKLYYVKGLLGIMHNVCRHDDGNSREVFRSADAVAILQSYLPVRSLVIRTKVLLILSYLLDETENDILNADDQNISFFIDILRAALNSDSHFSKDYGFHASEIVDGLNHLAANDSNKTRIVANNALPLYVRLIDAGLTTVEQHLATRGLWILAFNDDCKKAIKMQSGCMEALHRLWKTHTDETVRHAARGAIWEVNASHRQISRTIELPEAASNHIMISYQWDSKPTMIKVKDRLKQANYKVWMDIEHMSGSTLEAMALAVEGASVVIVCMSQRYKDSPSCRSEAEYTYRLRKDVIPLRLQTNYDPDGWLGMIVGTRLYFDISDSDLFESAMRGLIKELGDRGKNHLQSEEIQADRQWSVERKIADVPDGGVLSWQQSDVQFWLEQNNMKQHCDKFVDYNGELLLEMKRMHRDCPSFLYDSLQREMDFKLKDVLILSAALTKLPT
ncbi:uncharacterized protein LOC141907481 [Tubulanus polymorphus]|uniref:uncharacterized protein LOC141907481 n=1 Tax=Tubulanus polymorphus TaxID=672921 RepID=UPI003DA5C8A2